MLRRLFYNGFSLFVFTFFLVVKERVGKIRTNSRKFVLSAFSLLHVLLHPIPRQSSNNQRIKGETKYWLLTLRRSHSHHERMRSPRLLRLQCRHERMRSPRLLFIGCPKCSPVVPFRHWFLPWYVSILHIYCFDKGFTLLQ